MSNVVLAALALAAIAGDGADPLGPGRYCAYDAASEVSPPGDVRTLVDIGPGPRPQVSVHITWPHTDRVLDVKGLAQAGPDGTLRFQAEDGWGNRSEVSLTPRGDLDFDLAPPPDDWAASVTLFYGPTLVSRACRPEDLKP